MSQEKQKSGAKESEPGAVEDARTGDPAGEERGQPADEPKGLPLDGIRVVDVGNFVAGPYAASILSEFGAEVYKVEYPIAGDPMRRLGPPPSRRTRPCSG